MELQILDVERLENPDAFRCPRVDNLHLSLSFPS